MSSTSHCQHFKSKLASSANCQFLSKSTLEQVLVLQKAPMIPLLVLNLATSACQPPTPFPTTMTMTPSFSGFELLLHRSFLVTTSHTGFWPRILKKKSGNKHHSLLLLPVRHCKRRIHAAKQTWFGMSLLLSLTEMVPMNFAKDVGCTTQLS